MTQHSLALFSIFLGLSSLLYDKARGDVDNVKCRETALLYLIAIEYVHWIILETRSFVSSISTRILSLVSLRYTQVASH